MAYNLEPYLLSCGIEAAAFAADDAVRRDKTSPIAIFASGNGKPTIRIYNADGTTTTAAYFGDCWREGVNVG